MKKLIPCALLLAALVSMPAHGQDVGTRTALLAYSWNMNGEAADDDQVLAATQLADSTDYTASIAAQPDSCRLIDATLTDANSSITAGVLTIAGTDCLGYPRTCTLDFSVAANQGSGVKTLAVSVGPTGTSCYLKTVTSIANNALTGEGGAADTIKIGYTSNSADAWVMYGIPGATDPLGRHAVDPWNSFEVPLNITTSGASTTAVTSVSANAAFTSVAAGDLILVKIGSIEYPRKVVTRADANNIVVNQALNIPAAGVPFRYKKFYYSTDPYDDLWIPVQSVDGATFSVNVAANADTGGVVQTLYCTVKGPGWPTTNNSTLYTDTTASGSTGKYVYNLNFQASHFTHCRMGFRFGTNDDADAGAVEDITESVVLWRK